MQFQDDPLWKSDEKEEGEEEQEEQDQEIRPGKTIRSLYIV